MITVGIDAGSRTIKVVLLNAETLDVVDSAVADQGLQQAALAEGLLRRVLDRNELRDKDIVRTVATGYGRNHIGCADQTITEITCHAHGVLHDDGRTRTVLDIGGQDSKVIRLNERGTVYDFDMNDRCAAGTGRFLELIAQQLETPLSMLGDLASRSTNPASISSMCVVFAETEIVGLLASGTSREDIAAGVQVSIASRIRSMAGRNVQGPVTFTGGVALVPGMREALQTALGVEVTPASQPQVTGALGAAILAAKEVRGTDDTEE